jgi:phage host-nuclease inhibitor protein Gam
MSKTRKTKTLLPATITREEAENAFAAFAEADARQQKITATMDVQITKIREKYAEDLARLTAEKDINFEIIQIYATNNRDDFGHKKSMDLVHGLIGFRTGTPKLKLRKGFTWPSVVNLLKEFLPGYIRTTEEPAKDRLLADRDVPEVSAQFVKLGILVDQDETFFVEPKKEAAESA